MKVSILTLLLGAVQNLFCEFTIARTDTTTRGLIVYAICKITPSSSIAVDPHIAIYFRPISGIFQTALSGVTLDIGMFYDGPELAPGCRLTPLPHVPQQGCHNDEGDLKENMTKEIASIDFYSDGTRCRGRLFLPEGEEWPPVVVMGHGLGAQQDFRLPAFAERFVARGLAVFTFDYRHWGESDGEPRQLLIPQKQKQDWHAALACVRGLAQVDGKRLAIWGSSFGGAHVIQVAADDHNISAVVSQVMAADTASAVKSFGLGYMLKTASLSIADSLRGMLGLKPLYLPLVGKPGETAVMNTAECWDGYLGLVPEGSNWRNEVTARSVLRLASYRATTVAHKVTAPTLLMGGQHDSLVAIEDIRKLAAKMPDAVLQEYDCDHFQPYYPPMFETFVSRQADFLVEKLKP